MKRQVIKTNVIRIKIMARGLLIKNKSF